MGKSYGYRKHQGDYFADKKKGRGGIRNETVLCFGNGLLLTVGLLAGCAAKPAAPESAEAVTFDFEEYDAGFTAIYADYPEGEGVESTG